LFYLQSLSLACAETTAQTEPLLVHTETEIEDYWMEDPAHTSGPLNYDCSRAQRQLQEYRSVTTHKRFRINAQGRVENHEVISVSHPDYDWRCMRSIMTMIRYLPTPKNAERRPIQFDGEIKSWIPD
jgi:hypothetical protein